jgi:hypothetical protein
VGLFKLAVERSFAMLSQAKRDVQLSRLRWLIAVENCRNVLRRLDRQRKYDPNQPRVPAGNADGGQWTSEGGDGGGDLVSEARVWLASDKPPEVPKERPPTAQERNQIARGLAREGIGALPRAISFGAIWLYDYSAAFLASFDSPKTLNELQQAVSDSRLGYDIHHIIERATAAADGSERHLIDAPENLVRILRWKHWDLNRWYETPNYNYGRMTPRNYLRGKSWDERDRVGLRGLIDVGVLKP